MSQNSPRILIVDDEKLLCLALSRLLAKHGLTAITASDAESAYTLLQEFSPELALIDISLPQVNGQEIAKTLKDLSPTLKIIFMTGDIQPIQSESTAPSILVPHEALLEKPFAAGLVIETVKRVLN